MVPTINILIPKDWQDYELLDSGEGRKLERFGPIILNRPEQQAIWTPRLAKAKWESAHATFAYKKGEGSSNEQKENWVVQRAIPPQWRMSYKKLSFIARMTSFRHVGLFPEQAVQWDWLNEVIRGAGRVEKPRVLNLFAYTGIASLAASAAGAEVVHLDSSKPAIEWARENQKASGLPADSIRWIIDDALKFVRREARRGTSYDGIIMDPPAFGRGAQGQVWQFAESFPLLLNECKQILSPNPLFFLVTSYDIRASSLMLYNSLGDLLSAYKGHLEVGEHVIQESRVEQKKDFEGRLIATSIFGRWSAGEE